MRKLLILLIAVLIFAPLASAQKVNFGFDTSVDFSKYRTYSYPPIKDPDNTRIKAEAIMGEIDYHLKSKGLTRVESDADLIIVGNVLMSGEVGGREMSAILPWYADVYTEYGSMWTGWTPAPGAMVRTGNLSLEFYEIATKKKVWSGVVAQKLDEGSFGKNLKRIQDAIAKLLEKYPPEKAKK